MESKPPPVERLLISQAAPLWVAWLACALPARPRACCRLGRGAGRKVDVHQVLLQAASSAPQYGNTAGSERCSARHSLSTWQAQTAHAVEREGCLLAGGQGCE